MYYDCKASRPATENKTKGESVEPATDVLSLTIMPIEIDGKRIVKGVMELSATNAAAYTNLCINDGNDKWLFKYSNGNIT